MDRPDLDQLSGDLRRRHARLETYGTTRGHWWPTKAEEWVADLWHYDEVLVAAAELLGIDTPPRPPDDALRRLSRPERAALERGLKQAGIDVADHGPSEESGQEPGPDHP
jgi:hypothetical protein